MTRTILFNIAIGIISISFVSCNLGSSAKTLDENIDVDSTKKRVISEQASNLLPWKDSLAEFSIFDYAQIFDSTILRNNNTKKMFLARPSYKRSRAKKWKSLLTYTYSDSLHSIMYQTTNETDMGRAEYYSRSATKDTTTQFCFWRKNDSVNIIFYQEILTQFMINQRTITARFYEHTSDGFIDKTDDYVPKVSLRHFLNCPLDSTNLKKPKFLPIVYKCYPNDRFDIVLNTEYIANNKRGEQYLTKEFINEINEHKRHSTYNPEVRFEFIDWKFQKLPSDK